MSDFQFPYGADEEGILVIGYQYDFGDNWRHDLRLSQAPLEEGVKYPRCIAASRSGPPEDAGGPWSYADFVEAWSDPSHAEHKDTRRWAGRKFHPELCDLAAINKAIAKAMHLSKGDYRFRQEASQ